jgi:hypothetical protein
METAQIVVGHDITDPWLKITNILNYNITNYTVVKFRFSATYLAYNN